MTILKTGLYAVLDTNQGQLIIELHEEKAPGTVANFVELAEGRKKWKDPQTGEWQEGRPLYDGVVFHRLIPGFMVQGGDPTGTGSGGVGFTIPMERHADLNHDGPGVVAMARRQDPDSAGCQFYITFKATPFLDNPQSPYAVFGQMVHGHDVLQAIEKIPTGPDDRPREMVRMEKVTIKRVADGENWDVTGTN